MAQEDTVLFSTAYEREDKCCSPPGRAKQVLQQAFDMLRPHVEQGHGHSPPCHELWRFQRCCRSFSPCSGLPLRWQALQLLISYLHLATGLVLDREVPPQELPLAPTVTLRCVEQPPFCCLGFLTSCDLTGSQHKQYCSWQPL